MCGIAGIISSNSSLITLNVLRQMAASLAHRGPDGEACWINASGQVGFAHRRLSVIDTSKDATQPMHYLQRYTIVYNGEIYNYIELKEELVKKGYLFNNASDTQVILAAYDCYKENCVDHFDGMFAFGIWDEYDQTLFCARDRFGEKPFFYFYDANSATFYFGSEMKALEAAGLERTTNNYLLLQYLAHGYTADVTDASVTFDARFRKLPAAHCLKFSFITSSFIIKCYWQLDKEPVSQIPITDAIERFNELFTASVKRRLRSDVSIGASLSGGLDSSSVLSTLRRIDPHRPYKTFTATFPGYEKDESYYAKLIADKYALENFTVKPSADGLIKDFEKLVYYQEEPFTSASVYCQFKVFELAKQHGVTVLLDGQGADEILAGYDKYRSWYLRSLLPVLTAQRLRQKEINRLTANKNIHPEFIRAFRDDDRSYKPVVKRLNDLLYFDIFQYGLEELLRYADRNSMAHGREMRLPFLDHQLVSFLFLLPSKYKVHGAWTKWILRMAMNDILPAEIVWRRKKIGFEPPQQQWMLQPIVNEYIYEAKKKLVEEKILNRSVLEKKPVPHSAYVKDGFEWRCLVGKKKGSE